MRITTAGSLNAQSERVAWVDYAKGLCIIMVVMLHVTHDYGMAVGQEGWLHALVVFTQPFRMPDFFLLSGLFLSLSIKAPWREYLDRKALHFVYFYLVWLLIQLSITEPQLLRSPGAFAVVFLHSWVEPVNTLWFVHMLALFFVLTRLLRAAPMALILGLAAALQVAFALGWIDTGWSVMDRFLDRYVYFFAGYALGPRIFAWAARLRQHPRLALAALLLWAAGNGALTSLQVDALPGIGLLLGFAGAAAIVGAGSLLATHAWAGWLRYCGAHSFVIYLSFFLPMKIGLKILATTGLVPDVGTACVLITMAAVGLPLLFHWLIKDTWAAFLYVRPAAFSLSGTHNKKYRCPGCSIGKTCSECRGARALRAAAPLRQEISQ